MFGCISEETGEVKRIVGTIVGVFDCFSFTISLRSHRKAAEPPTAPNL